MAIGRGGHRGGGGGDSPAPIYMHPAARMRMPIVLRRRPYPAHARAIPRRRVSLVAAPGEEADDGSPIRRCHSRRIGGGEVTFCQKRTQRTSGVAGEAKSRTKPVHALPTFVPSSELRSYRRSPISSSLPARRLASRLPAAA
jgi:hypothetical protein